MREAERVYRYVASVAAVAMVLAGCSVEPSVDAVDAVELDAVSDSSGTTTAPARDATTTTPTTAPAATSTTTTSSTTTTTTEPPAPRRVSMAFTGDILTHSPLWRQAGRNADAAGEPGLDFRPMLARLAPLLDTVDLAVCHLETPIAPAGEEFTTSPLYGVPPEVVEAIAHAGYERCSTASNHVADRGTAGVDRTIEVLAEYGIDQSGMARTPDEIDPRVVDVAGVATSHLSYTFSYNGLRFPEGEEWRSAMIDPARIIADATRAREMGAELVVVSMHWGVEKAHETSASQRRIADELTASGVVDLIVGHHAHVLQPIEQVNGTWVVYGLGNVLSNMPTSFRWPDASQDAAVVTVEFEVAADGTVSVGRPVVHPTWVNKDTGWEVLLVLDELARDDISAGHRGRLERSLARTAAIVGDHLAEP